MNTNSAPVPSLRLAPSPQMIPAVAMAQDSLLGLRVDPVAMADSSTSVDSKVADPNCTGPAYWGPPILGIVGAVVGFGTALFKWMRLKMLLPAMRKMEEENRHIRDQVAALTLQDAESKRKHEVEHLIEQKLRPFEKRIMEALKSHRGTA